MSLTTYLNQSQTKTFCYHYSHKFGSLQELVEACKKAHQKGLACLLTEVCIKPRSSNEIAEAGGKWDIPRTELDMGTELGRGNFGIVLKGRRLFLENVHRQNNILKVL